MGENLVSRLFALDGRLAIVTGASRGIGWALADGLARAGANVIALSRSQMPEQAFPANVHYRSFDVCDDAAIATLRQAALDPQWLAGWTHKTLDILINAAGISLPGDAVEDFDRTLATNLRAPWLLARNLAPVMPGGSIINVTSLGAHRGFPDNPAYVAAKGGLRHLTQALAYDLGPQGVRVNNLVPGYIHTAMTEISFRDLEKHAQRKAHTMLERWGVPADLVGAAIFLASPASAYVTGQDIVVDGGWLAKGMV